MIMLDILIIVHSFADTQTASRIRQTCRRLCVLTPQAILYIKPCHVVEYEYRVGDKLHRLDGPTQKYISGVEYWYRYNIEHREYHPQCIVWCNGYREYKVEGGRHREAGPSIIYRNIESWYMRDKAHRKTGPARSLIVEEWFTLGKSHRLDGPASICTCTFSILYAIRGVLHNITFCMNDVWRINGVSVRG